MFTPSSNFLADLPAYCEKANLIGSLSNVSALLMETIPDINWVGFYLYDGERLRLGPFQGKPACTEIALGKGVCGAAALDRRTYVVQDVESFPGHITCDSASRAEIVVPLVVNGDLVGVLDIDSPTAERWIDGDSAFFEEVARQLVARLDFSQRIKR